MLSPQIQVVIDPRHSKAGLYISNLAAAQDLQLLNKLKIYSIVTVAKNCKLQHSYLNSTNYLYIPAQDASSFKLGQYFETTYNFIKLHRQTTNVLIHCDTGVSRSAAIVLSYLMRRLKMKFIQAYFLLRRKRSKVQPNSGFIFQLYEYESKLYQMNVKQEHSVSIKKQVLQKQEKKEEKFQKQNAKKLLQKKGILSSAKNGSKKKVSFKFIEEQKKQKEEIVARNNKVGKIPLLCNNKQYILIQSELKNLDQNISILKQRLNQKIDNGTFGIKQIKYN